MLRPPIHVVPRTTSSRSEPEPQRAVPSPTQAATTGAGLAPLSLQRRPRGAEPRSGPEGDVNALVHKACLELGITHIESLCNLEALIGQGEFRFICLPLKWRGGTGSPIRAVAVFGI